MASKREICLVVDVETCGSFGKSLVYDLGVAAVVRATGEIIERHSLVIADVFFGMSEMMQSAYYADKLPEYHDGIKNGAFRVVSLWQAWRMVRGMVSRYGIKRVYAYNASFDKDALNFTMYAVTRKYRHFFPRGVKVCCIWHMASQTILSQKRYHRFAAHNGLVSPAGNVRTSAEAAYAYMTKNPHFEESHTGLADVEIETEILAYVLRQKKRVSEKINRNAWKVAQCQTAVV